jgi:hypothetical protein
MDDNEREIPIGEMDRIENLTKHQRLYHFKLDLNNERMQKRILRQMYTAYEEYTNDKGEIIPMQLAVLTIVRDDLNIFKDKKLNFSAPVEIDFSTKRPYQSAIFPKILLVDKFGIFMKIKTIKSTKYRFYLSCKTIKMLMIANPQYKQWLVKYRGERNADTYHDTRNDGSDVNGKEEFVR